MATHSFGIMQEDPAHGERYDSYEPERQRSQTYEQGYDEESGHRGVHVFGLDTWWKKLVLLLGIIGVIVLVVAVIGGIISILAPIFIPRKHHDMRMLGRIVRARSA